ncbi:hypothetical protein H5T87_01470 [bacterium]|nr:hypothetical protein [bacterium]
MHNEISKEKGVKLLSEIIDLGMEVKSEGLREAFLWQIVPLIVKTRLGNQALPLLRKLLNFITQFDEATKQALLYALLRTVELCELGESEKRLIIMEMATAVGGITEGEFTEIFEKALSLSLTGLEQEDAELLLDMARGILETLSGDIEANTHAFIDLLSVLEPLLTTHLKEQAFQLMLELVDTISSMSGNKGKVVWLGIMLKVLENKIDEKQAEKILSKILSKAEQSSEEWRGALLYSISSKLDSLDLKEDSPVYAQMLNMAKEIKDKQVREETYAFLLMGLLKAGVNRDLLEMELPNLGEFLDKKSRFRSRLKILSEVYFLTKEGQYEEAMRKAQASTERLRYHAFLVIANGIARAIKEIDSG